MTDLEIERLEWLCAEARKDIVQQLEGLLPWHKPTTNMITVLRDESLYMLEEIKNLKKDLEEASQQLINAEKSIQHYKNLLDIKYKSVPGKKINRK